MFNGDYYPFILMTAAPSASTPHSRTDERRIRWLIARIQERPVTLSGELPEATKILERQLRRLLPEIDPLAITASPLRIALSNIENFLERKGEVTGPILEYFCKILDKSDMAWAIELFLLKYAEPGSAFEDSLLLQCTYANALRALGKIPELKSHLVHLFRPDSSFAKMADGVLHGQGFSDGGGKQVMFLYVLWQNALKDLLQPLGHQARAAKNEACKIRKENPARALALLDPFLQPGGELYWDIVAQQEALLAARRIAFEQRDLAFLDKAIAHADAFTASPYFSGAGTHGGNLLSILSVCKVVSAARDWGPLEDLFKGMPRPSSARPVMHQPLKPIAAPQT